jgi:hypothetical protein
LSLLGPLLRLLGRLDPRDAAAYEEAAREAFKAGTPNDVRTATPSIDAADLRAREAPPVGSFAPDARPHGPPTTERPASLGSRPTAKPHVSDRATAEGPAIDDAAPAPEVRGAVDPTNDLLRTPRSVTPVADDFFDGLIRRVEGER